MRDMNDIYVNDHCQMRIHSQGYVFTVEELVNSFILGKSFEELEKHEEKNYIYPERN